MDPDPDSDPDAEHCWNVSILCSLAGRYGYSAELAKLSKVRLKLPLQESAKKIVASGGAAWLLQHRSMDYALARVRPPVIIKLFSLSLGA